MVREGGRPRQKGREREKEECRIEGRREGRQGMGREKGSAERMSNNQPTPAAPFAWAYQQKCKPWQAMSEVQRMSHKQKRKAVVEGRCRQGRQAGLPYGVKKARQKHAQPKCTPAS